MLYSADVFRPLPVPGIHWSREHKLPVAITARGIKEQLLDLGLAIGCVRSHVTQIACEFRAGRNSRVNVRINAAVERPRYARSVAMLQLAQNFPAGEGKNQVELRNLVGAHVSCAALF